MTNPAVKAAKPEARMKRSILRESVINMAGCDQVQIKNIRIPKLQYKASDTSNRTQEDKELFLDRNLLLLSNP